MEGFEGRRNQLKIDLVSWEKKFYKNWGRKANSEDISRCGMDQKYQEYKTIKEKMSKLGNSNTSGIQEEVKMNATKLTVPKRNYAIKKIETKPMEEYVSYNDSFEPIIKEEVMEKIVAVKVPKVILKNQSDFRAPLVDVKVPRPFIPIVKPAPIEKSFRPGLKPELKPNIVNGIVYQSSLPQTSKVTNDTNDNKVEMEIDDEFYTHSDHAEEISKVSKPDTSVFDFECDKSECKGENTEVDKLDLKQSLVASILNDDAPKVSKAKIKQNFVRLNLKKKWTGKSKAPKVLTGKFAMYANRRKERLDRVNSTEMHRQQSMYADLLEPEEITKMLQDPVEVEFKKRNNCDLPPKSVTEELIPDGIEVNENAPDLDPANWRQKRQIREQNRLNREAYIRKEIASQPSFFKDTVPSNSVLNPFKPPSPVIVSKVKASSKPVKNITELEQRKPLEMYAPNDGKNLRDVLKSCFGHASFLDRQEETIRRILAHESTLLLSPTGSGKSICYQLPALILEGICLVVSPLVSLMQDQLARLPACLKSVADIWSSSQSAHEIKIIMDKMRTKQLKILFVSPERLLSYGFQNFVLKQLPEPGLSFVCIDEAHCVSEWSHNFRPSYLRIQKSLATLGAKCVLALTATATLACTRSICNILSIKDDNILRSEYQRKNVTLTVSLDADRDSSVVSLLKSERFSKLRSIIVYVMRQKQADEVAAMISSQLLHLKVEAYHAGKSSTDRKEIQNRFMANQTHIIIATVAFGMGLDKVDVAGVIHLNTPQSLESYIQEVGRAGRNNELAHCHVFYSPMDSVRFKSLLYSADVDLEILKNIFGNIFRGVAGHQENYFVAMPLDKQEKLYNIKNEVLETLLCILETVIPDDITFLQSCHNLAEFAFFSPIEELFESYPRLMDLMSLAKKSKSKSLNNGSFVLNICKAASHLKIHIGEIQSLLLKLKSQHDISLNFLNFSYILFIKETPENIDQLALEVLKRVRSQRQVAITKIDIIDKAMVSVAVEKFSDVSKTSVCINDKRLSDIIKNYFVAESDEMFVKNNFISPESDKVAIVNKLKSSCSAGDMYELQENISNFLKASKGENVTARSIAMIFHGIGSPAFPALKWYTHPMWGRHSLVSFITVMEIANRVIKSEILDENSSSTKKRKHPETSIDPLI